MRLRRLILTMIGAVFAATAGFAVTYNETTDGDLNEYTIPVFALDYGVNAFTGTVSRLPYDTDRLKFTIPQNATLDGISMTITSGYFSPTGVNGWNPVLHFWSTSGAPSTYTYLYVDGKTMVTPTDLVMPATLFPAPTSGLYEVAMSQGFSVSQSSAQVTFDYVTTIMVSEVPLPASLLLGLMGLGALVAGRRRVRAL